MRTYTRSFFSFQAAFVVLLLQVVVTTLVVAEEPEDPEDRLLVECSTTKGNFVIELYPHWAPRGVHRFVQLVEDGFFDGSPFFRAVDNFLVQFGIAADPEKTAYWSQQNNIIDDPKRPDLGEGVNGEGGVFPRGGIAYAGFGENSRSTQLFITYRDDVVGSNPWETQLGNVIQGMDVVDSFYKGYGDMKAFNPEGVDQELLHGLGNSYAEENFPELDYFDKCQVISVSEMFRVMPKPMDALFTNKSDKDVHLYWVSSDEEHFLQGELLREESIFQGSYTGHKFVVKEHEHGEVLATGILNAEKFEYIFTGAGEL